jgi:hypothetical protein
MTRRNRHQSRIETRLARFLDVWLDSLPDRTDSPPAIFARGQELSAEPHLPGFRVAVERLFGV